MMTIINRSRWWFCAWASLILLAACAPGTDSPALPTGTPVAIVKALATIGPTATLSEADRLATQQASQPTVAATPTRTPTATPYIGVFLGEAQAVLDAPDPIRTLEAPIGQPAVQIVCPYAPDDAVFGAAWRNQPRLVDTLRCPIQISYGFEGIIQIFQNGVMYFRADTNEVWAIAPGARGQTGQHWYVTQFPFLSTEPIAPAGGGRVPTGAIGSVWVGVPEIRLALGFATTEERPAAVNLQRFDRGALFLDVNQAQVFALLVTGDAYGPFPK
jgi:hypothetical protein